MSGSAAVLSSISFEALPAPIARPEKPQAPTVDLLLRPPNLARFRIRQDQEVIDHMGQLVEFFQLAGEQTLVVFDRMGFRRATSVSPRNAVSGVRSS